MSTKIGSLVLIALLIAGLWLVYRASSPASPEEGPQEGAPDARAAVNSEKPKQDYEIVTLLPKDGIPAIFDPRFLGADQADEWYSPDELVLGVDIGGDARAYSIPYLSGREIVNDTVGGRKIAVTW